MSDMDVDRMLEEGINIFDSQLIDRAHWWEKLYWLLCGGLQFSRLSFKIGFCYAMMRIEK